MGEACQLGGRGISKWEKGAAVKEVEGLGAMMESMTNPELGWAGKKIRGEEGGKDTGVPERKKQWI